MYNKLHWNETWYTYCSVDSFIRVEANNDMNASCGFQIKCNRWLRGKMPFLQWIYIKIKKQKNCCDFQKWIIIVWATIYIVLPRLVLLLIKCIWKSFIITGCRKPITLSIFVCYFNPISLTSLTIYM